MGKERLLLPFLRLFFKAYFENITIVEQPPLPTFSTLTTTLPTFSTLPPLPIAYQPPLYNLPTLPPLPNTLQTLPNLPRLPIAYQQPLPTLPTLPTLPPLPITLQTLPTLPPLPTTLQTLPTLPLLPTTLQTLPTPTLPPLQTTTLQTLPTSPTLPTLLATSTSEAVSLPISRQETVTNAPIVVPVTTQLIPTTTWNTTYNFYQMCQVINPNWMTLADTLVPISERSIQVYQRTDDGFILASDWACCAPCCRAVWSVPAAFGTATNNSFFYTTGTISSCKSQLTYSLWQDVVRNQPYTLAHARDAVAQVASQFGAAYLGSARLNLDGSVAETYPLYQLGNPALDYPLYLPGKK